MTKIQYQKCLSEIFDKVNGKLDIDWSEIKEKYNIPYTADTIRKASTTLFGSVCVAEFLKFQQQENDDKFIQTEFLKDGNMGSNRIIHLNDDELNDKNSLLKAHGFDPQKFELVSARNTIWTSTNKNKMYSSRIVVKPYNNISLCEVENFYKTLVQKYKPPKIKKINNPKNGLMLEIPIMDLHYGKKTYSEIVGHEYDCKLAAKCFNFVIDTIISRLHNQLIEKIIFPIGSDFFHIDTFNKTTTSGTPQDTDANYQLLFQEGVTLLIDGISKLSELAPVEVFNINGNHDFLTSYHAIMALWCYFSKNENVTVNLNAATRKYVEFGNCLIGFSHGDKESKRIDHLMQVEAKEAWGRTLYHEFHLGHLHSERKKGIEEEFGGLIIRNLPSISGTDIWHHISGYVGAIRKCTCFLWDKENGLDSTINIVI